MARISCEELGNPDLEEKHYHGLFQLRKDGEDLSSESRRGLSLASSNQMTKAQIENPISERYIFSTRPSRPLFRAQGLSSQSLSYY